MRHGKFFGVVGVVSLLFAQVIYFTATGDPYRLFPIHLVIGSIGILGFLFSGGLQSFRSSGAQFGLSAGVYTLLFLAVVTGVNFGAARLQSIRYDATEEKIHTLAPETIESIAALKYPLKIRGFFLNGELKDQKTRELLQQIVDRSPLISLEMVDPERQPLLLDQYGISEKGGTLHFTYELQPKPRVVKLSGVIDEQEIVNALKKVTRGEGRKVGYLFGHGEPPIAKSSDPASYIFFREAVEGENLALGDLVLGKGAAIPSDYAAVVVASPKRPLLPEEISSLRSYGMNGGSLLFFVEGKSSPEVRSLLQDFGILLGEDVILDQEKTVMGAQGIGVQPLITDFPAHPITDRFEQSILLTTASSVRVAPGEEHAQVIARTGPGAWGETNLELLFGAAQAALDAADLRGPVSIAVAKESVSKESEGQKRSRIVVIGDSDFINNQSINQMFNRDFALNALNWVVGEERGVTMRSRTLRNAKRGLTVAEFDRIFALTVILLPELLLLLGLYRWLRRDGAE